MRKWDGAWREEMESEAPEPVWGVCVIDPLLGTSTGNLGR
jgi:hypothetical protein